MITFCCSLWPYHDHSTGKQTNQKRPCHSWWHLRLPQSCLFGSTPQLTATGVGGSCWPQASSNAGQGHPQGGRLADWWCRKVVQQRNLAIVVGKSGPVFVPFFSFEAQSLVLQRVKPRHSLLFTEGRSHSRAEAGWHLWRWPCPAPRAEQGRLQQHALGCVQLSFEYFQAWNSTVSPSSLLLICTLYLQKPRVPLLCRNSKRPLSAASTDNAAFHLLCNCRRFWRTPISAGLTQGTGSSL